MTAETVMFSLLRAEVCGGTVTEEEKAALSEEMLTEIFKLVKKHDLAHLVGDALSKLGLLGDNEVSQKFKKAAMQAVYRYVKLNGEYQRICKTLEAAQIPFIPLKGAVLRDYYPEPWMRTSCDIDILIHETDVQHAIDALSKMLQYKYSDKYYYEYSLFSPSGVHLELHSNTIEKVESKAQNAILEDVWSTSYPDEGYNHKYVLTDDMFYFYHILHMAKHFEHGGCGIRPFLDLWILKHKMKNDRQKREKLLSKGKLLQFATACETLSEVWFSNFEPDVLSEKINAYILNAGMYGSVENKVAVSRVQNGGKLRYIFSRLFVPYADMKLSYPILRKYRWLTTVFQIVRWFKLIFKGGMKRSLNELKANTEISPEQIFSTADMLKKLGL